MIKSIPTEYEKLVPVQALLIALIKLNKQYQLFKPGSSVLDLGCGHGQTTNMIACYDCHVDGVDIDVENIQKAKNRYPNIHFIAVSAIELRTDTHYDTVVSQMVICNLSNEILVKQFIAQAYKLLKNNGIFFLSNSDVNTNFKNGDWMKHSFGSASKTGDKIKVQLLNEEGGYSEGWTNYVYAAEDLVRWLAAAGFKDVVVDNSLREKGYHFIIAKK